jgi:GntR family transcriptional repressor for pyruvate dehydrogenase complex
VARERGLEAGDQLPSIRDLAIHLRVKPTVVRDALLQAQGMGLLKVLPRAGAFLCAGEIHRPASDARNGSAPAAPAGYGLPREQNLFHLLDARRLIEIELVGRSAASRRLEDLLPARRALDAMLELPISAGRREYVELDIRFHVEIARLAGNHVLFSMQQALLEQLRPHLEQVPKRWQRRREADRSHIGIYDALVKGDGEAARRRMRDHLSLAYEGLLRDLARSPRMGATSAGNGK